MARPEAFSVAFAVHGVCRLLSAIPLALTQAQTAGSSVIVTATDDADNATSTSVLLPARSVAPAPADDVEVQDVTSTATGVNVTVGWTSQRANVPVQSSVEWRAVDGTWSTPAKDDGDGEFVISGLAAGQEFDVRVTDTNAFGQATTSDPVRLVAAASSDDPLGESDVPEDVRGDGSIVKARIMNKGVDGVFRPMPDVAVSFMTIGSLQSQSDFQVYNVLARGSVMTDADGVATIQAGFGGSDMQLSVGGTTATVPAGGELRTQDVQVDLEAVFDAQLHKDFPLNGVQYGALIGNKLTRLIGICNDERPDTLKTNYSICYRLAQAAAAADDAVADNWTQPTSEDTRPNAMRHGLWNAAAAHKQTGYDWGVIKQFTTAWESDTRRSDNPFVRRQATMDIHNNTAGRGVGIRNSRYPLSKVCTRLVQLSWKAQYVTFKPGQEWFASSPRKRSLVYYRKKVRQGVTGAGQTPAPRASVPLGCDAFKLAGIPAGYIWSRIVDQ